MTVRPTDDIEPLLFRIAAGARVIGAAWVGILVVLSYVLFREEMERTWLPITTAVLVAGWALVSVRLVPVRPWLLVAHGALAVDTLIALAALAASAYAGDGVPTFAGGVPLIVVAIAAIRGGREAWASAVVMIVATVGLRPGGVLGSLTSIVLFIAGAAIFTWIVRLLRSFDAQRRDAEDRRRTAESARARAEERVEISRHLHDSVLQTLALIQRRADADPEVTVLARRQERELRSWLFGEPVTAGAFAEAVTTTAAEVERRHAVPVELVTSGDADLTDPAGAVVAAAGEAMTNAALHSGAEVVSVFAEVTASVFRVYVRDRGSGFDVDTVPPERHGVSESIVGRMRSHGGSADVRSEPGFGTEWRLEVPR